MFPLTVLERAHRGLLLDVEAATEDASSALRRGVVSHRAVDESQLSQVGICDSTRAAAREVGEDLGADQDYRPRVVLEPTSAAFGAVVPDDTVDQGDRAARVRPTQGVRGAEQQSTPVRQDERDDHGLAVPDRDPVQLGGDPLQTWVDVKDPVQLRAVDDGGLRARSGQDQVIGDVQVARGRCVLTRSGDGQHVGPCRKGDRILPGVGVCFLDRRAQCTDTGGRRADAIAGPGVHRVGGAVDDEFSREARTAGEHRGTQDETSKLSHPPPRSAKSALDRGRGHAPRNRTEEALNRWCRSWAPADAHGRPLRPCSPPTAGGTRVECRPTFETRPERTVDAAGSRACQGPSPARRPARATSNFTVLCGR